MVQSQESFKSADIGFRNFAGHEGPYNKEGDRSFAIFLDPDRAQELEKDGWNIKWPKPMEGANQEEDTRRPYLQVAVAFNNFPPKVALIDANGPTLLEEEAVDMLDWAEIEEADVVIRPYNWTVNGKTGIKAYLKAIYVTIVTDEFSNKYGI